MAQARCACEVNVCLLEVNANGEGKIGGGDTVNTSKIEPKKVLFE